MSNQAIATSRSASASPRAHWMTSAAWQLLDAELDRLTAAVRRGVDVDPDTAAARNGHPSVVHLPEPDALRRLGTLRTIAEHAVVDDEPCVAVIGRRVTIRDIDGIESTYSLVLPGDGDPMQGWVSSDSPLGAALTGRRASDEVNVVAPAGSWRATIVTVE